MLKIEKNKIITPYTTLKVKSSAEFFCTIKSRDDLLEAIAWAKKNKKSLFILGGGSNILISRKIKGLVLKNEVKGIKILKENKTFALLEGMSGETWTKFVNFAVTNKLYGLENLFLIYGTVGGAPVQNIGAYGVELKDVFYELKAVDLKNGKEIIFSSVACKFGYRDSIFKNKFKGRFFIYSVTVKLKKSAKLKLEYGALKEILIQKGIKKPELKDIISAISEIRNSKLPVPSVLPNVGSFFKNVELSLSVFKKIQKKYPSLPSFPLNKQKVKIPSGWLIEQAGFKGKKIGSVRMYEKQALILVNEGGASASQVLNLVKKVKSAVKKKFGLDLIEEVNII